MDKYMTENRSSSFFQTKYQTSYMSNSKFHNTVSTQRISRDQGCISLLNFWLARFFESTRVLGILVLFVLFFFPPEQLPLRKK